MKIFFVAPPTLCHRCRKVRTSATLTSHVFSFHAASNYFYSVSLSLSCISFVSRVENSDFIQNVYQVWEINCWKLKQLNRIKRRQLDRKACAVYVWIFRFWFNFVFSWPVAFVLSVELIKNQFGLLLNNISRYNSRRDLHAFEGIFGVCAQTETLPAR